MTNWKLWLDDQLDDPETPERHTPDRFLGARSTEEARKLVVEHGMPWTMDLDHDLGEDDRTMDFLKWLEETYPNGPVPVTSVHSRNPEGAKNILSFVNSWQRSLKQDTPEVVLQRHYGQPVARVFTLDPEAYDKMLVFKNEHNIKHKAEGSGAIGGRYTYEFTQTSIGTVQAVSCACGERCDATNYEDW